MARKPRIELAGGLHHVYARGNNKDALFSDDEDHARYLASSARSQSSWAGAACPTA